MRWTVVILGLLAAVSAVRADIIYLNRGQVISGTVTRLDSSLIEVTLSDGRSLQFAAEEVFQATDDNGNLLYPLPQPASGFSAGLPELGHPSGRLPEATAKALSGLYRTRYRFPFWPLLGGAALLGYVGFSQLHASSDSYAKSVEREEAGLNFAPWRDRSQKQRTWGQISLAGAAACLIVALTPRIEKIPVDHSVRVVPAQNGLVLCVNF